MYNVLAGTPVACILKWNVKYLKSNHPYISTSVYLGVYIFNRTRVSIVMLDKSPT